MLELSGVTISGENLTMLGAGGDGFVLSQSESGGPVKSAKLKFSQVPKIQFPKFQGNGILSSLGSVATGSAPTYSCSDPAGRFMYVCCGGASNVVSMFKIQPDGTLTAIGSGSISCPAGPGALCCDRDGMFLYVGCSTAGTVQAYSIDQATGQLTALNAIAAGSINGISGIVCHPTAPFIYVSNYADSTVLQFTINPLTGNLSSWGAAVSTGAGTGPNNLCINPSGTFIFTPNVSTGNISQIPITDGTLGASSIKTVMGASVSGVAFCACDPMGKFLYTVCSNSNNVAYHVLNSTGIVNQTGMFDVGTTPQACIVDPSGAFLWVANLNGTSGNVSQMAIEISTGLAKEITSKISAGNGTLHISFHPSGRYAYVVNAAASTITAFSVSPISLQSYSPKSNVIVRQQTKNALAASSNAVVLSGVSATYGIISIIDNKNNYVQYSLYNGTLTQLTTNTTYSVTSSPAASKIGLQISAGVLTIYTGSTWTGYSWAAFIDNTN